MLPEAALYIDFSYRGENDRNSNSASERWTGSEQDFGQGLSRFRVRESRTDPSYRRQRARRGPVFSSDSSVSSLSRHWTGAAAWSSSEGSSVCCSALVEIVVCVLDSRSVSVSPLLTALGQDVDTVVNQGVNVARGVGSSAFAAVLTRPLVRGASTSWSPSSG